MGPRTGVGISNGQKPTLGDERWFRCGEVPYNAHPTIKKLSSAHQFENGGTTRVGRKATRIGLRIRSDIRWRAWLIDHRAMWARNFRRSGLGDETSQRSTPRRRQVLRFSRVTRTVGDVDDAT